MLKKSQNQESITRIEKTTRNAAFSILGQGIDYILRFISRIIFVKYLAVEYLGLSGLFSNILSMLCLADLGVAYALNYSLYKPLAEKNTEKIKSLMWLYKKTFQIIGIVIIVLGLFLLPWYKNFMKEIPDIPFLDIIYILYIFNTAISYFFSYKRNLLIADQNKYLDSINACIFSLLRNITQIIILVATHNYILYLVVQVLFSLLENISISITADKNYTYLKDKNIIKLEKEETIEIIKNTGAMMCHKIGSVVVNGTDNLLISKFVGLAITGLYSNYVMIINMFNSIIGQLFNAATASVGNLVVTESTEQRKNVFYRMSFIQYYIYAICTIGLACMFQSIIQLIFGKKYLLDSLTVGIIILNFYLSGMRRVLNIYRDSTGTYYYDRYKPLAESVINLVVSIILVQKIGLVGVFIGTTASTLLTCFWIEPLVVFKYVLKRSTMEYFVWYLKKTLACMGVMLITWTGCHMVKTNILAELIIDFIICLLVPNICFWLLYHKNEDYKYCISLVKNVADKMFRRFMKGKK